MAIRTVGDLRKLMAAKALSPETLSKEVKISGMTIRRLLKKQTATAIPEKYFASLDRFTGTETAYEEALGAALPEGTSFDSLLGELEKTGKKYQDLPQLKKDTQEKLQDKAIGRDLRHQVDLVLKGVFLKTLPLKYKALCIGAILYFINPIDLIPDAVPIAGYLDDFAVLTLVAGMLANWMKKNPQNTEVTS